MASRSKIDVAEDERTRGRRYAGLPHKYSKHNSRPLRSKGSWTRIFKQVVLVLCTGSRGAESTGKGEGFIGRVELLRPA